MTRARDLARIANSNALSIDANLNVGIGSTSPRSKLNVVGVVSATTLDSDTLNVGVVSATTLSVSDSAIIQDLTVNGTQTVINTTTLDISDKTVGIASTSTPSNSTANGAGIVVYGGNDGNKSITWDSASGNWVVVGGGISATSYEGVDSTLDTWLYG